MQAEETETKTYKSEYKPICKIVAYSLQNYYYYKSLEGEYLFSNSKAGLDLWLFNVHTWSDVEGTDIVYYHKKTWGQWMQFMLFYPCVYDNNA